MEPEINTLTPPTDEKPSSNKILFLILGFFLIAIVVLVVVIIIINNQPAPVTKNSDTMPASTGLPEEEVLAYYNFQDELKKLEDQASSMLNETPQNITGVHELYSNAVDNYLTKNEAVNATYCLSDGAKMFTDANLPKEALKVYEDKSLPKFDQITQYMLYRDAFNLATSIGDNEKINYYNQKLIELEPAWEQYLNLLDEESDNYEKELEELKNQP